MLRSSSRGTAALALTVGCCCFAALQFLSVLPPVALAAEVRSNLRPRANDLVVATTKEDNKTEEDDSGGSRSFAAMLDEQRKRANKNNNNNNDALNDHHDHVPLSSLRRLQRSWTHTALRARYGPRYRCYVRYYRGRPRHYCGYVGRRRGGGYYYYPVRDGRGRNYYPQPYYANDRTYEGNINEGDFYFDEDALPPPEGRRSNSEGDYFDGNSSYREEDAPPPPPEGRSRQDLYDDNNSYLEENVRVPPPEEGRPTNEGDGFYDDINYRESPDEILPRGGPNDEGDFFDDNYREEDRGPDEWRNEGDNFDDNYREELPPPEEGDFGEGDFGGGADFLEEDFCEPVLFLARLSDIAEGRTETEVGSTLEFFLYPYHGDNAAFNDDGNGENQEDPVGLYVDSSTQLPDGECIFQGAVSTDYNDDLRSYDSQLHLAGTCSATYNSITGGSGGFSCATGYGYASNPEQAPEGYTTIALYVCFNNRSCEPPPPPLLPPPPPVVVPPDADGSNEQQQEPQQPQEPQEPQQAQRQQRPQQPQEPQRPQQPQEPQEPQQPQEPQEPQEPQQHQDQNEEGY